MHKAQGVTVDRAHVLARRPMDRHAAYVGLSRHREGSSCTGRRRTLRRPRRAGAGAGPRAGKDTHAGLRAGFALRREITPAAGPDAAVRRERLAAQVARARGAAAQLAEEGRARRFAADWRQLELRQEKLVRLGDRRERQLVTAKLAGMEARLGLDPALQATLCLRHRQLGVSAGLGRALRDPGRERTRERSRGFGLEL